MRRYKQQEAQAAPVTVVPEAAATAIEEQEQPMHRQSPVTAVPGAAATTGLEFEPREQAALTSAEVSALLRRRSRKRVQRARARARAGHGAEGEASSDGSAEARSGDETHEDESLAHTDVGIAKSQRAARRPVSTSDDLSHLPGLRFVTVT